MSNSLPAHHEQVPGMSTYDGMVLLDPYFDQVRRAEVSGN